MLAQIQKDYPEDVRIAYRHFPLIDLHDKALLAAQAANAAGAQGKFWEMHDLLFESQSEWAEITVPDFETWLGEAATDLELDVDKFTTELQNQDNIDQVQTSYDYYASIGLPGTPFLVFNGLPIQVSSTYESISSAVEAFLLEKRQYQECPEMVIDPEKQYTATIQTEKGDVVVELYASSAPLAVNSFVFLAQEGWFDNVTFHRVLPGFVAQGGDPSGSGMGGPGYQFANETSPDLKFDTAGLIAMANSGPDTNGSQFFITFAPTPDLDGGYTIFGRVISGMEIVESLTPRDPAQGGELPAGDKILGITITER